MNLTKEDFIEKISDYEKDWSYKGELPCLIDFFADWCAPCKILSSVLNELEEEYKGKINIYKIDVDYENELSSAFNIRSVPTILICPKNSKPGRIQGYKSKSLLKEIIEDKLLV